MRPAKASPFGSNGDDRRQWRKQGGAVGAAASRMRAAAKQTLGAATRAVSPKVTERASPAGKSRCAAIGRLFVRAILSRRRAVWQRPSPLSRACARQLPQRGSHWHVGRAPSSYNLSVSLRSPAPLVGEPLAKPFTLRGLPRPPLGRGGGSASALTERLSPGSVTPAA